ncbi:tryptophan--tRNA ligase [Mesomycoplasma neurolyticum]|uniref:Tryptophan--tRNA ligase n=1 Tax=Mesomycoplasma neurolyticum TaxID=2120 RepID=A0A449A4Y7_9BACT|nr:tryptophan--tRNA ligase [Mesomycoplasma neurolyticum]VEU59274.1 tryptophan--tRNA ligase [Mesomycoplasma neurolyticum]
MNKKEKIVTGITATGKLTIGNYIGAIQNALNFQNDYQLIIFVADLHALTLKIKPEELEKNRKEIFALYLAAGIDPEKSIVFYQSDIAEHSEMNWYCLVNTTLGELNRMTQFKDKSQNIKNDNKTNLIPTGLLIYPTLMAADILLYNPKFVPVGLDQTQHIELTRNIASRLNKNYKTNLNLPKNVNVEVGSKIMSLTDPNKKMSKSDLNKNSAIYLLDEPDVAYKKILKAITDSENKVYFSENKPGVSNLLTIYSALKKITIEKAEKEFINANYKEFKEKVAEEVKEFLINLQSKYNTFIENVDFYAEKGKAKAQKLAQETLSKIKEGIGLK